MPHRWQNGRELASMTSSTTTWHYTYNADGLRTQRANEVDTYTYIYNGSKLVQMSVAGYTFRFTYDASGTPLTFQFGSSTYYYVTNLQGDVIGIKNSSGQQIVTYTYDAWGNLLYRTNTQLADYNPLRYRGYVYDFETGLYYLQSRYYDPEIGRFINADGLVATGQGLIDNNMFAYCGNNPINRIDTTGQYWGIIIAVTAVIAVIAVVIVAVKAVADNAIDKSGANEAEKRLAKKDYVAAYKVNQAKIITEEYINKTYGRENDRDGTQVNAYRHAMWSAIMTDKIGVEKATKFANAHEAFPGNTPKHIEMDRWNNALGRRIALEYAGQGYDVFSQKIIEAINNGEAKVIRWDQNANKLN